MNCIVVLVTQTDLIFLQVGHIALCYGFLTSKYAWSILFTTNEGELANLRNTFTAPRN